MLKKGFLTVVLILSFLFGGCNDMERSSVEPSQVEPSTANSGNSITGTRSEVPTTITDAETSISSTEAPTGEMQESNNGSSKVDQPESLDTSHDNPNLPSTSYPDSLSSDEQTEPPQEEVSAIPPVVSPTPKSLLSQKSDADIFVYNGIVYLNVVAFGSQSKEDLIKITVGESIGTVQRIKTIADDRWEDFDASVLSVGTEIYSTDISQILAVKSGNEYIQYYEYREG